MNDRVKQFRVGVVVLATSIIGAILVTLNGPTSTEWIPGLDKHYQVTIELREAPGIGPNTPIRKNGLLIGRVAEVEDRQDHVAVKANIDAGRLLYSNYRPQVRTTLLGDATLEFITAPVAAGATPVGNGAVFAGTVSPNPMDAIIDMQSNLKEMVDSLRTAGDEVGRLAQTMNTAIGPDPESGRVPRLLDTAEQSMVELSKAAQTFNEFFGDPEIKSTIREARMTMNDVREVATAIQSPIEAIDRNLKNLEGLTEPLGRNGQQVSTVAHPGPQRIVADRRRADRAHRVAQQPRRHDRPADPRPGRLRQPQPPALQLEPGGAADQPDRPAAATDRRRRAQSSPTKSPANRAASSAAQ